MTTRLPALALAAALTLSACGQGEDHTIVQGGPPDPLANELANAAPPPPLPVIAAEKSYRCDGNEIVEIDWLESNGVPTGATVRAGEGADTRTLVLTAGEGGSTPFTSTDGASLTGTKTAGSVNLTLPGGSARTCRG